MQLWDRNLGRKIRRNSKFRFFIKPGDLRCVTICGLKQVHGGTTITCSSDHVASLHFNKKVRTGDKAEHSWCGADPGLTFSAEEQQSSQHDKKITGCVKKKPAFPFSWSNFCLILFPSHEMNTKYRSAHWKPKTRKCLQLHISPWHGLVSLKSRFPCVLFMAQLSHNSRGSVLPQLDPLCFAIHSRVSWVRSPEPSWILSLRFIGWQLIYPLYTFQMTGLSLQERKEEPERENMLWVLCARAGPSPRAAVAFHNCNIQVPRRIHAILLFPAKQHEMTIFPYPWSSVGFFPLHAVGCSLSWEDQVWHAVSL